MRLPQRRTTRGHHRSQWIRASVQTGIVVVNVGADAGQTVGHTHVHVIPRYLGDVPDPRGGVRSIIPGKAKYWE